MYEKDIVLMYTFSPFPVGEATSNRIFALALCIQSSGYKVIVLSNGTERACDYDVEKGIYEYKTIEYRNFAIPNAGKVGRIINRINIFSIINKHTTEEERKRICFVYSTYRNYGLILHFALKNFFKFPAIVDVTEWHSSNQFKYGKLNLSYLLHTSRIRYLLPKAKNIICITTYLDNYFNKQGCNTIVIPPQVVIEKQMENKAPKLPPVKLFYAGISAKKDYLDIVLNGLSLLTKKELVDVKCTLVGMSLDVFKKEFPRSQFYIDTLKESLSIVDRMPKKEVEARLSESHFLILMRPKCRYSDAGFPSKVPEALAAGVPVITNRTSDLCLYIQDGKNGIIVDEFTPESFAIAIRKVIKINDLEFKKMSEASYQTSVEHFNYCVHKKDIMSFFDKALMLGVKNKIQANGVKRNNNIINHE